MEVQNLKLKLEYLKENIDELKLRFEDIKKEKGKYNKKTLELASTKLIEEIIETATKINNILLESKNKYSTTYYESFMRFGNEFGIDSNFIKNIVKTTSFRNKLVHTYEMTIKKIDFNEKVKNIIDLFSKYILEVKKILEKLN
jgi:uncharacterized protein YutE (UPF0331/DUF86 family)